MAFPILEAESREQTDFTKLIPTTHWAASSWLQVTRGTVSLDLSQEDTCQTNPRDCLYSMGRGEAAAESFPDPARGESGDVYILVPEKGSLCLRDQLLGGPLPSWDVLVHVCMSIHM